MEKFNVFYKEIFVGTIGYDRSNDIYKFVKSDAQRFMPPEFSSNPFLGIPKDNITEADAREFIVDRVFPKERQALEVILDFLDLGCWDPWEIFVRCSGLHATDSYWIDSYEVTEYNNRIRRLDGFKDRKRESTHPEMFLF